jgi:hypothetical protein
MRVKFEIKHLYKKKQFLNQLLFKSHLENANKWDLYWTHIEQKLNAKLQNEMKHKHLRLNQKLEKLTAKKKNTSNSQSHPYKFYPRIFNNTNIELTTEENELLSKGLQYNINYRNKKWFKRLTLEADAAVALVNPEDQVFLRQALAIKLKIIYNKHNTRYPKYTQYGNEMYTLKALVNKLQINDLIITRADISQISLILTVMLARNDV